MRQLEPANTTNALAWLGSTGWTCTTLAVLAIVLGTNPVRDVQPIKSKQPPKGAPALSADQLRDLLTGLRASDYCREHDLADPFTVLVATGLRRGELLALRWIRLAFVCVLATAVL